MDLPKFVWKNDVIFRKRSEKIKIRAGRFFLMYPKSSKTRSKRRRTSPGRWDKGFLDVANLKFQGISLISHCYLLIDLEVFRLVNDGFLGNSSSETGRNFWVWGRPRQILAQTCSKQRRAVQKHTLRCLGRPGSLRDSPRATPCSGC